MQGSATEKQNRLNTPLADSGQPAKRPGNTLMQLRKIKAQTTASAAKAAPESSPFPSVTLPVSS
jgi:hypothetical protein